MHGHTYIKNTTELKGKSATAFPPLRTSVRHQGHFPTADTRGTFGGGY